jgi:Arc/MetJ family transcription regulator
MRTNIVLDDQLVKEAFSYSSNIKTKRELIEVALKEYVSSRKVKDLRDLRGKIQFDENYDHKKMRTGE